MIMTLGILMIYLDKFDTLKVVRTMLADSERMLKEEGQLNRAEELRGLRWYMPLAKKDYLATIETFLTYMPDRSKSIKECLKHMTSIEIDVKRFIQHQFNEFFSDYLPFDLVNTMFTIYLNEGIKIWFRVGYAFFKTMKDTILCINSKDEFDIIVREAFERFGDEDKKQFMKLCFHLRIVKIKKQFSLVDTHDHDHHKTYYCAPEVIGGTTILTNNKILNSIFDHIPSLNKSNDLKLIFSTSNNGRSLNQMILKASDYGGETAAYLLLIETSANQQFGCYLQHELLKSTPSHQFTGVSENFIFTLKPDIKFYRGDDAQKNFFSYDGSLLMIGAGKEGCSILLESDLVEGHTSKSEIYRNPTLTPFADFKIKSLELFALV